MKLLKNVRFIIAGESLFSLLTAFEVVAIPVASGIIALYSLTKGKAAEVWFGASLFTGVSAIVLDRHERDRHKKNNK